VFTIYVGVEADEVVFTVKIQDTSLSLNMFGMRGFLKEMQAKLELGEAMERMIERRQSGEDPDS
jgi:hypothetical protein